MQLIVIRQQLFINENFLFGLFRLLDIAMLTNKDGMRQI